MKRLLRLLNAENLLSAGVKRFHFPEKALVVKIFKLLKRLHGKE
jgi:hypothetical protein